MNTQAIVLSLAIGAAIGSGGTFAAVSKTWDAFYTAPSVSSLSLSVSDCKAGACDGSLGYLAQPASAQDAQTVGAAIPQWGERIRWTPAQVRAFAQAACVVDDSSRPKAFAQTLAACAAPADAGP